MTAACQRIVHAGERFVGAVGWPQNEQTYDALRLQSECSVLRLPVDDDFAVLFKLVRYDADGHATDKLWLMLTYRTYRFDL